MKQKDSVRAFKNELRNYEIYRKEIRELTEDIELLYDRLGGVRGIDPSKEPLHTLPNKDYEFALRNKISVLEAQKGIRAMKVKQIDEILDRIETSLKTALIAIYAKGKTLDSQAMAMEISPSGLLKRMNRAIEEAVRR